MTRIESRRRRALRKDQLSAGPGSGSTESAAQVSESAGGHGESQRCRSRSDAPPRRGSAADLGATMSIGARRANQEAAARSRFHADDSASYDEDFTGGPTSSTGWIFRTDAFIGPPSSQAVAWSRAPRSSARSIVQNLDLPSTTDVSGIGKTIRRICLEQLNLRTVRDLLYSLPRDYVDYTRAGARYGDLQAGPDGDMSSPLLIADRHRCRQGWQARSACGSLGRNRYHVDSILQPAVLVG